MKSSKLILFFLANLYAFFKLLGLSSFLPIFLENEGRIKTFKINLPRMVLYNNF